MAIHQTMRDMSKVRRNGAADGLDDAERRSLMKLTDGVLARLEELNLADRGGCCPDSETARSIRLALAALPPEARRRFGSPDTVQEALDGLFEVQDELLRPWQREQWMSPYDAA